VSCPSPVCRPARSSIGSNVDRGSFIYLFTSKFMSLLKPSTWSKGSMSRPLKLKFLGTSRKMLSRFIYRELKGYVILVLF
jgi:hypothetical protein